MLNVKQKEGISMENAIAIANEKIIWYSTEERIMSFHFVVNYTKKIFNSYIDMFRFALGLIDIGFKIMWGGMKWANRVNADSAER